MSSDAATEQLPPRAAQRAASAGIVAAMVLVAFGLWTLIPLAWVWIGSQLGSTSEPSFGAYALILVGIPATIATLAKVLAVLERTHDRLTAIERPRHRAPWLRSMRGERGSDHQVTVLDRVMITTLTIAIGAMAVWFFFFASLQLPG